MTRTTKTVESLNEQIIKEQKKLIALYKCDEKIYKRIIAIQEKMLNSYRVAPVLYNRYVFPPALPLTQRYP